MFSTARMTFCHGNIEPFYTTVALKLIYVIYLVLTVLLMLNMIIGVMGSTVGQVTASPQKEAVHTIEWLKEALALEYAWNTMTCFKFCCLSCMYHKIWAKPMFKCPQARCKKRFIEHRDCSGLSKLYIEVRSGTLLNPSVSVH
jgi:hypothetical protein